MIDTKSVIHVTDESFTRTIAQGVTLVDFWAPWCMPCRMQSPILDEVAKDLDGSAKIAKLNVDEDPNTASQYGVSGIPTLILFKNGEAVKQFVGLQNADTLKEAIQNA